MKEELIGNKRFNAGQGVFEVLIALAILSVCISAGIFLILQSQSFSIDAGQNQEAIELAKKSLENTRAAAKSDFASLNNSSSTEGRFLRETIVEYIDDYSKKITSRVSWQDVPSRPQKIEFSTILTKWEEVADTPDQSDAGGGGISGDWMNPRTLGSVDLGPGNSATDLDVVNKIIYLSAEASAAAKPDFFIVDAINGENPFIVSSLNTGAAINALDATENYAYAANRSTSAQLQVIDVSDKNNPSLATSFQLPGVSGSGAVGNTIFYGYSKVFIGTKKATGPEFHIVDVSNPLSPVELGSFEVNADVNGIYVSGSLAYVANSSDNGELKIFDISNPSVISQIASFDATGNTEDGKVVQLAGSKLYLGRTVGGNHINHHELYILDMSSSTSPQSLGSKDLGADLNDLRIRNNLAFIGVSDSNKEFQVWDVSNPASPALWSSFNFPQVATGIDYEDNLVYVSVRSNDAIRIITSSP